MPGSTEHDERGISYDRNGNILSLSRTDNGTRLDSLAYTYSGNRLLKVNDRVSTASPNHFPANTANHGLASHYTYDANGNLTADRNKGISSTHIRSQLEQHNPMPGTPFSPTLTVATSAFGHFFLNPPFAPHRTGANMTNHAHYH